MRIAVFGTGMVGQALAARLAEQGHDVMVGTRDVAQAARATEMLLPIWLRLFGVFKTPLFNFKVVR